MMKILYTFNNGIPKDLILILNLNQETISIQMPITLLDFFHSIMIDICKENLDQQMNLLIYIYIFRSLVEDYQGPYTNPKKHNQGHDIKSYSDLLMHVSPSRNKMVFWCKICYFWVQEFSECIFFK